MKTKFHLVLAQILGIAVAVAAFAPQATNVATAVPGPIANKVLAHNLDIELGRVQRKPYEALVSSGPMYALLGATGILAQRAREAPPAPAIPSVARTQGCPDVRKGNGVTDIKVNQDCSYRRQAEEVVAVNPMTNTILIAGQNDSRIGYNHCGYDWSMDGGRTWGDQIPPFYQFTDANPVTPHTFDACSDPTATWDAQGNAYVGGVLFDVFDISSAFIVQKSNAGINGQFYHTPLVQNFQIFQDLPPGVVANDYSANILNDKEFIVADSHSGSPKANYVYATWTRFNFATGAGVGSDSPIYFSQSSDGGATWSAGLEISGANSTYCTASSGETNPNACDQDQGSHPIVGPDGTLYVAFYNYNTPTPGINQHMLVSCPATADCSVVTNWTGPLFIVNDIATQPVGPYGHTGCPAFRQCLPPNGYRMSDDTEGSISVDNNSNLYLVWADYRNGQTLTPNCTGAANTATPPCDNDVFFVHSSNRGATWSTIINITPQSQDGLTAQWQPWSAVTPDGTTLFAAYYDRSYGTCETTGCNDITLAKITCPCGPSSTITYTRLTGQSMPNLIPNNNPVQAGFLGDYMWVTVDSSGNPYVVWADTKGLNGTVEENIYYYSNQTQ